MLNFGLLVAEISSLVWGTPANFNRFRLLAALLRGTLVVGVSQTLRRWMEGTTYIQQGGHHVLAYILVGSFRLCKLKLFFILYGSKLTVDAHTYTVLQVNFVSC